MDKELIILAIYINVDGLSHQCVEEEIYNLSKEYENIYNDTNKNIKVYYLPVTNQETRIECVYPPVPINNGNIENELLKIYKLLINLKNDKAKDLIMDIERKLKLKNLINKK
jgi:intein/homing endonuclease